MKLVYMLVGGVIAAGGFAASGLGWQTDAQGAAPAAAAPEANVATIPTLPPLPAGHPAMGGEEAAPDTSAVEGEVLEVIDVNRYTYVRVGARGTEGVWAAVPRTTLKAGARIRILDAIEMRDFKSESLHRTFDSVYFGVLEGAPAAPSP